MVEWVGVKRMSFAQGLKIPWTYNPCGFKSRPEHNISSSPAPSTRKSLKWFYLANIVGYGIVMVLKEKKIKIKD